MLGRMETTPVIQHPTVTLDDKPYELILDNSAIVTLHELGVEMEDIAARDADGSPIKRKGAEAVELALKLIAAGISHTVELKPKQIGRMKGARTVPDLTHLWDAINLELSNLSGRQTAGAPEPMSAPQIQ